MKKGLRHHSGFPCTLFRHLEHLALMKKGLRRVDFSDFTVVNDLEHLALMKKGLRLHDALRERNRNLNTLP